jgi:hypothetical protein
MNFRNRRFSLIAAFLLFPLVAVVTGCSSKTGGDVTGSVTLNGKPLTSGTVVFHIAGQKAISAAIGKGGTYYLQKPPKGDAKVSVEGVEVDQTAEKKRIAAVPTGGSPDPKNPPQGSPPSKAEKVVIPEKYKSPSTSGLSLTISGSAQTFDIAMTGEEEKNDKK